MTATDTPRTPVARRLAEQAAAELREALTAAGFTTAELRNVRGDTTASAEPFVALGRLTPAAALRLAEIARAGTPQ